MAIRSVRPNLLHSFPNHLHRRLCSAAPPLFFSGKPAPIVPEPAPIVPEPPRIINLDDHKKLFSSLSTAKLIGSSAIIRLSALKPMVNLGTYVINSKLMGNPVTKKIVLKTIELSFYKHFCAGKNLNEVERTVTKLWKSGISAMLDYGLEHADDNESCDRNLVDFVGTVGSAKAFASDSVSFIVVKITAICPPTLLKRMSDLLRWEHKNPSFHLPWKLETLPLFSESSPFYHTLEEPKALTHEEERDLQLANERLIKLCEKCLEDKVPLLIDAEDTAIQPAIDYFTYSAAIKYRKECEEPFVFNTIQAYLKDSKDRLVLAKRAADKMGVRVGFKLVRGAYMSSEERIAKSLGAKSPINDGLQRTHDCYNDCAAFMLEEIAKGSGSVVLATHNLESGELAASKANSLGIKKGSKDVHFAQLYGMSEALSFGLRNAGFRVSKYLPFGPVEQIMPYLLRRAEENKGLLAASSIDRDLMRKELLRRLTPRIS